MAKIESYLEQKVKLKISGDIELEIIFQELDYDMKEDILKFREKNSNNYSSINLNNINFMAKDNGNGNIYTNLYHIGYIADQFIPVRINHIHQECIHGKQQHDKLVIPIIFPCITPHCLRRIHKIKIKIFPEKCCNKKKYPQHGSNQNSLPKQAVCSVFLKFTHLIGIQHGCSDADHTA